MLKTVTTYIHKEDDENMQEEWFANKDAYLNAMNWGYELEVELEVDTETGDATILAIDGKAVAR